MAELVDALASGASVRKYVKVQVLSSAPRYGELRNRRPFGGDDLDFYSEMVRFYAHARTYFSTKL